MSYRLTTIVLCLLLARTAVAAGRAASQITFGPGNDTEAAWSSDTPAT